MSSSSLGWRVVTYLSFSLLLLSTVMNMYTVFGDKYLDVYTCYFAVFLYLSLKFFNVRTNQREVLFPREFALYFFYTFLVSLFTNISSTGRLISILTLIIIILSYIMYWDTYRTGKFVKFYTSLAVFIVGFFFIQVIVDAVTGMNIMGVIPGLSTSQTSGENALNIRYDNIRYCSLFSEPSHMAQFLMPLFIFLLFDKSERIKYRMLLIVFLFLSLLLLKSGTAIVLLIPSAVFFVYTYTRRTQNKFLKILLMSFMIVIGVGLVGWYLSSQMGAFVSERGAEIFEGINADQGTSGFVRIWRGYFVYDDFSLSEKIFGNDSYNDIIKHVYHSNMELYLEGFALTYFNAVQFILIHSGLIGFLLFLYFLYKQWKGNTVCGKCLITTLFLLMLIESVYGSAIMATFLLMAQSQKTIKY